jgi:hypothetical protein
VGFPKNGWLNLGDDRIGLKLVELLSDRLPLREETGLREAREAMFIMRPPPFRLVPMFPIFPNLTWFIKEVSGDSGKNPK